MVHPRPCPGQDKEGGKGAPLRGLGSVGGVSSRQKNALLGYSGTSEPIAQTPAASQNQPTLRGAMTMGSA